MRYLALFLLSINTILAFKEYNSTEISQFYNSNLKSIAYQNKLYLYSENNTTSTTNLYKNESKFKKLNLKESIFDNIEIYGYIEFKFQKDI